MTPARPLSARRRGFTLLEVLITAVLLATLLAVIWQLFQMFAALYETGYVQTEKAQLVRSLTQQLAEDLLATVPPVAENNSSFGRFRSAGSMPTSAPPARNSSYAGRMGLLGTYNTLRLDVLQTDPPPTATMETEASLLARPEPDEGERSGDLATVVYLFTAPPMTDTDALVGEPGLKRREVRLNQSSEQDVQLAASLSDAGSSLYGAAPRLQSAEEDAWRGGEAETTARTSVPLTAPLHLPEVVALEFRYFDGKEWTDAWDSRARRGLPLAVEISFDLEIVSQRQSSAKARAAGANRDATDAADQTKTGPLPAAPTLADLHEPKLSHRFVVFLPQASRGATRSDASRSAAPDEAGAAADPALPLFEQDAPEPFRGGLP